MGYFLPVAEYNVSRFFVLVSAIVLIVRAVPPSPTLSPPHPFLLPPTSLAHPLSPFPPPILSLPDGCVDWTGRCRCCLPSVSPQEAPPGIWSAFDRGAPSQSLSPSAWPALPFPLLFDPTGCVPASFLTPRCCRCCGRMGVRDDCADCECGDPGIRRYNTQHPPPLLSPYPLPLTHPNPLCRSSFAVLGFLGALSTDIRYLQLVSPSDQRTPPSPPSAALLYSSIVSTLSWDVALCVLCCVVPVDVGGVVCVGVDLDSGGGDWVQGEPQRIDVGHRTVLRPGTGQQPITHSPTHRIRRGRGSASILTAVPLLLSQSACITANLIRGHGPLATGAY